MLRYLAQAAIFAFVIFCFTITSDADTVVLDDDFSSSSYSIFSFN